MYINNKDSYFNDAKLSGDARIMRAKNYIYFNKPNNANIPCF